MTHGHQLEVLLKEHPIDNENRLKVKRISSQYKKSEAFVIGQNLIQNQLQNPDQDQRASQDQRADQGPHQGYHHRLFQDRRQDPSQRSTRR